MDQTAGVPKQSKTYFVRVEGPPLWTRLQAGEPKQSKI